MPDGPVIDAAIDERFFQRLPAAIAAGLTVEQRTAISGALAAESIIAPPMNFGFTAAPPFGRWFINILLGRERRGRGRPMRDRAADPQGSLGKFLLFTAGIAVCSVLSAIALLLYLALLEF